MKVVGDVPVPDTVAVPCEAGLDTLHVSVAPASASVAPKVGALHAVGAPSSDMVTESGPAPWVITGGSFTAWTVTFTTMVSASVPSETRTVKLSEPLQLAVGA